MESTNTFQHSLTLGKSGQFTPAVYITFQIPGTYCQKPCNNLFITSKKVESLASYFLCLCQRKALAESACSCRFALWSKMVREVVKFSLFSLAKSKSIIAHLSFQRMTKFVFFIVQLRYGVTYFTAEASEVPAIFSFILLQIADLWYKDPCHRNERNMCYCFTL